MLDGQIARLRADSRAGNCREEASGAQPIQAEVAADAESPRAPVTWVAVARIDWLARSTFHLFAIVEQIADAGADSFPHCRAWADTSILLYMAADCAFASEAPNAAATPELQTVRLLGATELICEPSSPLANELAAWQHSCHLYSSGLSIPQRPWRDATPTLVMARM